MTMKTHLVANVLSHRIAWLGAKMAMFDGDHKKKPAYNWLAQEKAATEYARDLVQREDEFKQRLKVEGRFTSRDEAYYDEFIREVAQ